MADKLSDTLHYIYEGGLSSLTNPYLEWLGKSFIQPHGLMYEYFDFDPIASFEEDGLYPVLVGPKIVEVQLPEETPEEIVSHQRAVINSTSDDLMLLDIELDHNLAPRIRSRRSLDERNTADRPLMELQEKVKSSDAYFDFLKSSLGFAKMASDDLLRFIYENRGNEEVHSAILRNDYDSVMQQTILQST